MFTMRGFLPRAILNYVLTCLLFFFFQSNGWIIMDGDLSVWQIVLITSLILTVVGIIIAIPLLIVMQLAKNVSAGTGCLAAVAVLVTLLVVGLPVIAYGEFYLVGKFTGMFMMTTVWWQVYLIGLAFCLFQFRNPSESKTKKVSHIDLTPLARPETAYAVPATATPAVNPEAARWAGTMEAKPAPKKDSDHCIYCGTRVFPTDRRCPSCGGDLA